MRHEGGMYCYAQSADPANPNYGTRFSVVELAERDRYIESYGLLLGRPGKGHQRRLADAVAILTCETGNGDGGEAVAVYVLDTKRTGHKVGYLTPDAARRYASAIRRLESRTGSRVGCRAHVSGRGAGLFSRPVYNCSLYLPDPGIWADWVF